MGLSEVEKEVRKLRKRLRQIENLERQEFEGRELSEEEENKVLKKKETRTRLQQCLVLFAEEIEYGGDLNVSEDVPPSEVSSETDSEFTIHTSNYTSLKPSTSLSTMYSTSTPKPSKTYSAVTETFHDSTGAVGNYADSEWKTVGEKKSWTTVRPEEPVVQVKVEPKLEVAKKNADKRAAIDSPHIKKEPEPPKKQRKEAMKATPKMSEADQRRDVARMGWAGREWAVLTLEGHNDLVSAVHLDRACLLSGSRDTTLKVWNIKNGFEEKSLGGHTDAVTALLLLSECASNRFTETYELGEHERLIVSGSQDCSLKIWALSEGRLCRSVYTYNPITALAYLDAPGLVVAGSGGGKVELWDPETGSGVQSLIAHQDAITALTSDGSMVYSSSVDGIIKVYQIRDRKLHVMHESDDVTCTSGSPLLLRHIRSMTSSRDMVYYGDDGNNVKVLDWKRGQVHKLKNHHTGDFGSTDAMCCHDSELLTAGYNLDHGVGYINVWSLPAEDYVATLRDDSLTRIMCLSCASFPGLGTDKLMVATGGFNLQLWLPNTQPSADDVTVRSEYIPEFSASPEDSDLDSEGEMSESDNENVTSFFWRSTSKRIKSQGHGQDAEAEERGWFSYCQIL